jgi:hypothetical protein
MQHSKETNVTDQSIYKNKIADSSAYFDSEGRRRRDDDDDRRRDNRRRRDDDDDNDDDGRLGGRLEFSEDGKLSLIVGHGDAARRHRIEPGTTHRITDLHAIAYAMTGNDARRTHDDLATRSGPTSREQQRRDLEAHAQRLRDAWGAK